MSLLLQPDAHLLSNSKEPWVNAIHKLIVDLRGKVAPETVEKILQAIKDEKIFVLHNDEQLFYYNSRNMWGQSKTLKGEKVDFKFSNKLKLIQSVQLTLLTMPQVYIPLQETLPNLRDRYGSIKSARTLKTIKN